MGEGPYKQREARLLLGGIDYKTFVAWCRTARPPVEPLDLEKHPKLKIDRRALWYTRAALERLAREHNTTLMDEELQHQLQNDMSARLDHLEHRLEQERLQLHSDLLSAVRQEVERQIQTFEAQIRDRVVAGVAELLPAVLEDRLRQEIEEQVAIAFRHVRLEFAPRSLLPPPADS